MASSLDDKIEHYRGTVIERDSGNYLVRFRPKKGNDEGRISKTLPTKEEAVDYLEGLNIEYDHLDKTAPSQAKLKSWLRDWIEAEKQEYAKSTASNYKGYIESQIIPEIGDYTLSELVDKPKRIKKFLSKKKGERAGSTVHKYYIVLNQAFDEAIDMKEIDENPMDRIDPPSQESEEDKKFLEKDQLRKLIETVEDEAPWFEPHYHFAINTGVRQGELLGLSWSDIDFGEAEVSINRQLKYESGEPLYVDDPKKGSDRTISLHSRVLEIMREYKEYRDALIENIGEEAWYGHDRIPDQDLKELDLVFTRKDGEPIPPYSMFDHFQKMLKKADLPKVKFHSLRDSHASILIDEGLDIKKLQRRLGHKSVQTTLKHYSHLLEGGEQVAAEKFGGAFYD